MWHPAIIGTVPAAINSLNVTSWLSRPDGNGMQCILSWGYVFQILHSVVVLVAIQVIDLSMLRRWGRAKKTHRNKPMHEFIARSLCCCQPSWSVALLFKMPTWYPSIRKLDSSDRTNHSSWHNFSRSRIQHVFPYFSGNAIILQSCETKFKSARGRHGVTALGYGCPAKSGLLCCFHYRCTRHPRLRTHYSQHYGFCELWARWFSWRIIVGMSHVLAARHTFQIVAMIVGSVAIKVVHLPS